MKANNFNTTSFASLKQDQAAQRKLGKRLPDKSDYTRESLETYPLTMPELKRMRKVPASMILKIERIPQNIADDSSTNKRGFVITGNDVEDCRACISMKDVANFPVEATPKTMLEDEEERGYCSHESTGGDQWRDIPKASLPDPVGRQVNAERQTNEEMYHHQRELQTSAHETQVSCSPVSLFCQYPVVNSFLRSFTCSPVRSVGKSVT